MGLLDGKVVIITGAARAASGSATADVVYEQGAVVVPTGRDGSELALISAVRRGSQVASHRARRKRRGFRHECLRRRRSNAIRGASTV